MGVGCTRFTNVLFVTYYLGFHVIASLHWVIVCYIRVVYILQN